VNFGGILNSSPSIQPIIIVGCQRSGTTLLRTILGRHPQLLEHPDEPQYILELYQRFGYHVGDVATAVAYLLKHPYLPENITREALQEAYASYQQLSLHDFCHIYLQVWAGEHLNYRRPVLKDPAFVYYLDVVDHLFPEASIIHVVRDPRGSVASQKTRWHHFTTWECLMLWKRAVQNVAYWKNKIGCPILETKYREIISYPEESLELLCHQLGISFFSDMLTFEENTVDYKPNIAPRPITLQTIDTSRLGKWQKLLAPLDIRLVEYGCRAEMRQYDYELDNPHVPFIQFYGRLLYEWLYYQYRTNGRLLKNLIRKIGWRLGIGLLKVPPKI
jgi:hypothetical protein